MAAIMEQQHGLLSPQQMLQVASLEKCEPETDSQKLRVAAQLSWLASQHHASEYNQLKFGSSGSPAKYIPLSIQLPSHVRELRIYQENNAQKQAWWFSSKSTVPMSTSVDTVIPVIRADRQSNGEIAPEVQDALSLAMSSPLPPLPTHLQLVPKDPTGMPAKTSESHPINMSAMLPFELQSRLPAYLQNQLESSQPTYLCLPHELTLDALTAPGQPSPPVLPPLQEQPPLDLQQPPSAIHPSVILADIMKDIPTPPPAPHTSPKLGPKSIDPHLIPLPPSPSGERGSASVKKEMRPPSEGNVLTSDNPTTSETPSYFSQSLSSTISDEIRDATSTTINFSKQLSITDRSRAILTPTAMNGHRVSHLRNGSRSRVQSMQLPQIGNLLLSSCPGKKVRLQGPVKGRGTICRDLGRDLLRIREAGVGCIICCLDDSELHFLGAPWEEYSKEAHQLGIDILRIPIPEGFAPLDVAALNSHLDVVIQRYTMRGVSLLVHCRGGVGRAGLVACCWMLKMGLCGWLREIELPPSFNPIEIFSREPAQQTPDEHPSNHGNGTLPPNGSIGQNGALKAPLNESQQYHDAIVRLECVDLVERVIRVVRRRRSVKAIETFEQVHFLVEFVEYLRRIGLQSQPELTQQMNNTLA